MRKTSLLFVLCAIACSKDDDKAPALPFAGVASFNTNLSSGEPLTNYTTEYQAAFNAGARGAQTAAPWGSLNPTGTTYDLAPISNPYFGLATLKTMGFEAIFLNIPIITIGTRSMPSDIITLSFNDPAVKARFRALIDVIKDQLNDHVQYISLGNEVDTYFSTHANEWPAYINLVEDARSYLRSIRPDILVGVTTTFEGAAASASAQVSTLNATMDIVALTYYPISSNFIPRDPSTVKNDVARMISLSNGKPLVMQEWGYPSSTVLGSSENTQASFFSNSLTEFKIRGAEHFPFVSFFKFRDWTQAHCEALTGQTVGQNFYEFMSSLGTRKNDGTSKPAFDVLQEELN